MGLQIKSLSPIQGRVITTLIAVFALVAQPMYGVVNSQFAGAVSSEVTNVVFTSPEQTVSQNQPAVMGIQLRNTDNTLEQLSESKTKLILSTSSSTGQFADGSNSEAWKSEPGYTFNKGTANKTFRYKDSTVGSHVITVRVSGGGVIGEVASTQSIVVVTSGDSELEYDPEVKAENFNTHSGSDYKGINVGFSINSDFGQVSSVKVDLYRDGNLLVTNEGNQKLYDLINEDRVYQHSTPFIISGSYVEKYWTLGSYEWSDEVKPDKAVITVTGENGTDSIENLSLSEASAPFKSLLSVQDKSNPIIRNANISKSIINQIDSDPVLTATVDGTGSNVASAQYRIHTKEGAQVGGFGWVDLDAADGAYDAENEHIEGQLQTTGLLDGEYIARVRAFDQIGNKKSGIDVVFSVDRTAPTNATITVDGDSRNGVYRGPVTIVGSVDSTVIDVKSHWFEINGPGGIKYAGHNISTNKCTLNESKTSCTFTLDVSDGSGEYVIRYVVADNVGNRSDGPNYSNTITSKVVYEMPSVDITPPVEVVEDSPKPEDQPEDSQQVVDGEAEIEDNVSEEVGDTNDSETTDATDTGSESATTTVISSQPFTAVATPFNFAGVLGVTAPTPEVEVDEAEEEDTPRVLGEQTDRNDDTRQFEQSAALTPSEGNWSLLGLAWYWWLALLAAVAAIGWAIIVALRRRHDDLEF